MNEDILYKLALRLSTFYGDPHVSNPTLLVEKLPETFPLTIPLPEESRVLGSLIRGPESLQILLDVPLTASEVRDFYQQKLLSSGWSLPDRDPGMPYEGGFLYSGFGGVNFHRYENASGWSLNIQIGRPENNLTDVRLQFNHDTTFAISKRRRNRFHGPEMFKILPPLSPPEGAEQQGGGGSSGSESVYTSATLKLPETWPVAAITRHYVEQLQQAAWTSIAEEQTEHSAWSTWTFHDSDDEEWSAAFYLFQLAADQTHYQLSLRADWRDPQAQDTSGRSWITMG